MIPTDLERECRVLTRYLTGSEPTPYVIEKYCNAHRTSGAFEGTSLDHWLTNLACAKPLFTLPADAYARFFASHGLLRRKLILLLAILEVSPPFFKALDRPGNKGVLLQGVEVAFRMALFFAAFLVGILFILPASIVQRIRHS
jgi:hypothetical protein